MNDAQIPTEYILIVYVVTLPCPSRYDYDILDKKAAAPEFVSAAAETPGLLASVPVLRP